MAPITHSSTVSQQLPTGPSTEEPLTTIRWKGKVGPANLNSDYAIPFTVTASTREEAIAKAIRVGGYSAENSSVWIHSADVLQESSQLTRALMAKAWREGNSAGRQDYAASVAGGLPLSTPNPYEETDRG